jgi:hypothetical protein
MTSALAPGEVDTRSATCSALVCLLQRTTSKTPSRAAKLMAGLRHDAGLGAGTTMASRRPRRDRSGGAGTFDTSWESAAWDARCWTFLKDRCTRLPLTDHHPGSAPTRTAARSGLEGLVTLSGSPRPELGAIWRTRRREIALQGIARSLLGPEHR